MKPLQPVTPAGERVLAACRRVAASLIEGASASDRDGQMCPASFEALEGEGVLAAFVPEALGGGGLSSVHDWTVLISEIARHDASVAIASNMHLGVSRGMSLAYAMSGGGEAPLKAIAAAQMRICATATERGTDNLHPLTEAVADGDGWKISGTKMFVTMSPIATHLAMNVRLRDDDGDFIASTMVPINTPGIVQGEDWDALGMRASGSQSIRFEGVKVPAGGVRKLSPWGEWSVPSLMNRALANLPLVGASLGIAEAACAEATALARSEGNERAGVHTLVAEAHMELELCRSVLSRAALNTDEFLQAHKTSPRSMDDAYLFMQNYQMAKSLVNGAAIRCVNKAMDIVGGRSFGNTHVLSRLYRDARAAPFMQPGSPADARSFIGRVALGDHPVS